jgi:fumarate reductase subunit C
VCFQETHSNNNIEKYWEDEWGNKCVFSHHDSKSAGVCVMFKKGLDFVIHNTMDACLLLAQSNTSALFFEFEKSPLTFIDNTVTLSSMIIKEKQFYKP